MNETSSEYPPTWMPSEVGDTLSGTLVRYSEGPSSFGEGSIPIAVIVDEAGEEKSLWCGAVLGSKMARTRRKPGERIIVKYLGTRESASRRSYIDWSVELPERPAYEPDWAAMVEPEAGSG